LQCSATIGSWHNHTTSNGVQQLKRLMGSKAEARFAFISDKAEFASDELLDV
jgi:hypothetical protein